MKLFGKSKQTPDQIQRQAAEELEAAVARAVPPTDAQRTWVLPTPDVPDLRPPVRRPASRASRRPLPDSEVEPEVGAEIEVDEAPPPAVRPARGRSAPAATKSTRTKAAPRTNAATTKPATRARSKA